MSEYKSFEELKEELGDKFEDYMYKANIELLNKLQQKENVIKEVRKYIEEDYDRNQEVVDYCGFKEFYKHILEILDKEKE